jgi:Domain of unknown function (DUF4307)
MVPEVIHPCRSPFVTLSSARSADRYGAHPKRRWRPLWLGIGGFLLVAVVGVLFQASTDAVRSSLVAWETPTSETMAVSIEVVRRPGTQVTCDLVALDIRHVIVGQASVEVPASDEWRTRVDTEIALQGDAVAPELRECEAVDQR